MNDPLDQGATSKLTPLASDPAATAALGAGGGADTRKLAGADAFAGEGPEGTAKLRLGEGADTRPLRAGADAEGLGDTAATRPIDAGEAGARAGGPAGADDVAIACERLLLAPNAFEPIILPFDRSLDVPDVSEIHSEASAALFDAVERAREDGRSRALLLRGESGTGKTHLLRRVAAGLGRRALFAAVDPIGDPERLLRHILRRAVQELSVDGPDGAPHLKDLAGALAVEAIYALPDGREREALLDAILTAEPGFLQRDPAFATRCVHAFASALSSYEPLADKDVLRVLLGVRIDRLSSLARDWLRGVDLDDEDLAPLGVHRSLAEESEAEVALRTLAAGARLFRPLVLCFDQTETLRSLGGDRVVRALFAAIARLRALPGLVIVFTCLEDVWAESYEALASSVESAPLPDGAIALRRLGPRELRAILGARLQRVLGGLDLPYPTWPVPERTLAAFEDLSPREALEHCARALAAMRERGAIGEIEPPRPGGAGARGAPGAPGAPRAPADGAASGASARAGASGASARPGSPAPAPAPRGPRDALVEAWAAALEGARALEPDEETVADGLFHLLRIGERHPGGGWPDVRGLEREQGTASIVLLLADRRGAPTKLLVSDTQNGTSFAKLLDRLLGWLGPRHMGRRAVLVRLAPERETWTTAQKRLDELTKVQGRLVRPTRDLLARLAAARSLLGQVAAGDVAAAGRAVSEAEALAFLRDQPDVAAALGEVLGGAGRG